MIRFVALVVLCLLFAVPAQAQSLPPVIERYEQLLVRSPGKGTAFDKVYQHFFEGEGLEKLQARWKEKTTTNGPETAPYWVLLGALAERQGNAVEAIRCYQKATELKPDDARMWMALGDAQVASGKPAEAVNAFQSALARQPAKEVRPQLYRQLARSQQRAFDIEGAIKTWQQLVAESPDDPFVIEEAADALTEADRFVEAAALLGKLRDLPGVDPYRRVMAIMKLAQLEEKQDRREKARELYESALPLAAETSWIHREVRARIEESFRRQDDLPGLTSYYQAWLEKRGKDVEAALRLSDALKELNRGKESVEWLRKAVSWAPDRSELQVALAKRLGETEQPQEAVTILSKLTLAHPEEESYREFLGNAHWQVFEATKDDAARKAAVESWRQLAPEATKDVSKISRIADLFRAKQLSAEALEYDARAVRLAPEVPELRQHWAEYLFELKRDDEAWKVLEELAKGERATAPNFLRLARLQMRYQKTPAALESIGKGLALEPKNYELLQLEWRALSQDQKWAQAAALFPQLLAAAPGEYSVEQVEEGQIQAFRALGTLEKESKELSRRLGKEPTLSEPELRLLVRLTLQEGDLDAAADALKEARQRFPQSPLLLRKQVEYEKRRGNLENQVAALEELLKLQPKQQVEFLRQIVRVYQDAGLWDKALAAGQRVIDAAPASADSYSLSADLNFGAQRFDTGVARLREAIKLSDRPNELRLRLAREFLDAGRIAEGRQALEAAFDAETDPKARLSLTRQLAEAALRQGKLDDLIASFRQRQRAEEGGWRYALYLAEIFQQMQDYGSAREELSKALGARSRDGNFIRQLQQLSEAEGNTRESARFARLLAEAEPSEEHQVDLADALLDNGETDEALKVVQDNEASLLKDPTRWRDVLLQLHAVAGGEIVSQVIQKGLSRDPADWQNRLTLAELEIGVGEPETASKLFWEVFDLPPEAVPNKPAAAAATPPAAMLAMGYPGGYFPSPNLSSYTLRIQTAVQSMQVVMQVVGTRSVYSSRRGSFRSLGYSPWGMAGPTSPSLKTQTDARDRALVYLGVLAQQQGQEEAFMTMLEAKLQKASRAERIVTYAMLGARRWLNREIASEAEHPSGDAELDSLCFQMTCTGWMEFEDEDEAEDVNDGQYERAGKFLQREKNPLLAMVGKQTLHRLLVRLGRTEEAKSLATEILGPVESMDDQMLASVFGFAVQQEDYAAAEKALRRLTEASHKPGQSMLKQQINWYSFTLADALLKKKETRQRGVELLAESLQEYYPLQLPGALTSLSSFARNGYRSAWREETQFPYPNRYFDVSQIQRWQQAFQALKAAEALGDMEALLNKHIQSLPGDQSVYAQLLRACFRWWADEKGKAISEVHQLARELKDDDLRLMVAAMLTDTDQSADALTVLEEVSVTGGDLYVDKLVRMLGLAQKAQDKERAKTIALQLMDLKLDPQDQMLLANALSNLGLEDQVKTLAKKSTAMNRAISRAQQPGEQLNALVRAKNGEAAGALARSILARDPLVSARQGNQDYERTQALQALKTFRQLDEYRVGLEKQLAQTPTSVRALALLAEAWVQDDRKKALDFTRRLVAIKPTDVSFQLRLADFLKDGDKPEGAIAIWEKLLQQGFDPLIAEHFSEIMETFQKTKQMSRLGAALLKLPKTKNSPMMMASMGQELSQYFNMAAEGLRQEENLPMAIELWRAGLERSGEYAPMQGVQAYTPLITALLETGDKAGAAQIIEQYFFPPAKPAPIFGFDRRVQRSGWTMALQGGRGGGVELASIELLKSSLRAGSIGTLREKAVSQEKDAANAQGPLLVLFIDALQRDPARCDEMKSRLAGVIEKAGKQRDQMSGQLLLALAQQLREWAEGRRVALAALQGAKAISDLGGNAQLTTEISVNLAETAKDLDEDEVAREALRAWTSNVEKQRSAIDQIYRIEQPLRMMELMMTLGLKDEAQSLVGKLKASQRWKRDASAQQKLADYENRMRLTFGQGAQVGFTIWASAPDGPSETMTLNWELGPAVPAGRSRSEGPDLAVSGESFAALDGRYSIDLFQGTNPRAMEKIATIPAAKARGSWAGPARLKQGWLMAIARQGETNLFSRQTLFSLGPNLIENPELTVATPTEGTVVSSIPGWAEADPNRVTNHAGGPRPEGRYVQLAFPQDGRNQKAVSKRITLEAGRDYRFAGWLRATGDNGSTQLEVRFFRSNGDQVSSTTLTVGRISRNWFYFNKRLIRDRESDSGNYRLQKEAVECEISIEGGEGCDLDGLYLGVLEPDDAP